MGKIDQDVLWEGLLGCQKSELDLSGNKESHEGQGSPDPEQSHARKNYRTLVSVPKSLSITVTGWRRCGEPGSSWAHGIHLCK